MADRKITAHTELTGASVDASNDWVEIVDVSDVTDAASGTNKKIKPSELLIGMGVTASAAELNILDGATLSTAELNYVDGVTSAIQTQLDAKASTSYVDSAIAGLKWKASVVVATTIAGTLASDFENGDTVDGITLTTGDRILIKNQASGSENGIYIVAASGAPARATDADSGSELVSAAVFVQKGTANADKAFVCTNDTITIGVTSIVFTAFASVVGALISSNNLSDVANASTARTNLGLAIGTNVQAYSAVLTDIAGEWTAASSAGPASLDFHEDTDNGVNKVNLKAPDSLSGNFIVELPSAGGTLALTSDITGGQDASKIKYEDDFQRGNNLPAHIEWIGRSNGSGSASVIGVAAESKHTGIVRLNTGTTNSGWGAFSTFDNTDELEAADGDFSFEVIVKTPSSLSDGTDTYTLRFGLNASNGSISSNAVIVRYSHGVNSGKWEFVHARGGVETTLDSGITVVAGTWYRLKFTITGAGQILKGFVNGSSIGTVTPANAIAAGNRQGLIFSIAKTVGTNDRIAYVDYVYFEQSANR